MIPEGAEGTCRLEGTFTHGLYAYLDPAALALAPSDALWLVDYGLRMPGVVESGLVARALKGNRPAVADALSVEKEQDLWKERLCAVREDPWSEGLERPEGIYHLVQDRPVIEHILEEELPPDE